MLTKKFRIKVEKKNRLEKEGKGKDKGKGAKAPEKKDEKKKEVIRNENISANICAIIFTYKFFKADKKKPTPIPSGKTRPPTKDQNQQSRSSSRNIEKLQLG